MTEETLITGIFFPLALGLLIMAYFGLVELVKRIWRTK